MSRRDAPGVLNLVASLRAPGGVSSTPPGNARVAALPVMDADRIRQFSQTVNSAEFTLPQQGEPYGDRPAWRVTHINCKTIGHDGALAVEVTFGPYDGPPLAPLFGL